ncbi:MAG: ester cyclase [Algicola sp.]|nr:ester cyclase [Algicola sp.]
MRTATEVAHEWFEQVWNLGDGAFIDRLLAERCIITGLTAQAMTRTWQFHEFYTKFNIAFTAIHATIEQLIEQKNSIAGMVLIKAKHRRSGLDIAFKVSFFGKVEYGRFIEVVNMIDYMSMLEQLNLIEKDFLNEILYTKE